MMTNRTQKRS